MKKPIVVAAAAVAALAAWRLVNQADQVDQADFGQGDSTNFASQVSSWLATLVGRIPQASGNSAPSDGGDVISAADAVLTDTTQTVAETVDYFTGGYLQVSSMSRVPRNALANPNVQAFLRVIRAGEGTSDEAGYSRLFGGGSFSGFADHPRTVVRRGAYASSAAGAYQFIQRTWDETARIMGLTDFSPASQDLAALGRIAARGALDDVIAGRFDLAIKKVAREWASMPGSPYGQPTITLDRARRIFAAAGGDFGTMQA